MGIHDGIRHLYHPFYGSAVVHPHDMYPSGNGHSHCSGSAFQAFLNRKIPDLPYVRADDTPVCIDTDYLGERRSETNPCPGPFELPKGGKRVLKVWPISEVGSEK